jgi:ATP-dependent RNA helicase RhlE
MTFDELNLNKQLLNALNDLGLASPTPIQEKVFSVVMSGKDVCAIAQTGTGKTFGYLLPCLRQIQYSKQRIPQLLILVPTRELVVQVVEEVQKLTTYMSLTVAGIYGGVNTKPQMAEIQAGIDILVATPGRLNDFLSTLVVNPKTIKRLVIDEFDEMLNLGFRPQLENIFDKLPPRRQNLLFSATLTADVAQLIDTFFEGMVRVEAAPLGTPLTNITQGYYEIPNFYTKINFTFQLLSANAAMRKVLVFISTKKLADLLYKELEDHFGEAVDIIHSNLSQNNRFDAVNRFETGDCRILIATDIVARGIDVTEVTHVINFDLPEIPENYIHRIGRTGRADKSGIAISFVTESEQEKLKSIETLMNTPISRYDTPPTLTVSQQMLAEEIPEIKAKFVPTKPKRVGSAFQQKSAKNSKVNVRRDHEAEKKKKYGKSYEKRKRD